VSAEVVCGPQRKTVSADQAFEADPGPCTASVTAEGFEPAVATFEVPPGPPFEHTLQLAPKVVLGRVELAVVDPAGKPVLERVAWAFDGGAALRVHEGLAQASVPPGSHTVRVFAQGYAEQRLTAEVGVDAPVKLTVTLEPLRVVVTKTRIEFEDTIRFATGEATIEAASFPLLDDLARVIVEHPELLRVRIEGHTDDRGDLASNQALSEARAAAVRDALVSRGVAADRLVSVGFGETRPLDPRGGPAAWDVNRRVELHVEARE
jgi:outer membrane protein OmpA-like peptidoglycan-associated protein